MTKQGSCRLFYNPTHRIFDNSNSMAERIKAMKWHISVVVAAVLCPGLFFSFLLFDNPAQAQSKAAVQKITVLSPMGKPPSIELKAMAPRLDALDGKTLYLINDGYISTDVLLGAMQDWFKANMPKVNTVYRKKAGDFVSEEPQLWAEVKEKADAVVMGMGH
jgi:hypothetical protein